MIKLGTPMRDFDHLMLRNSPVKQINKEVRDVIGDVLEIGIPLTIDFEHSNSGPILQKGKTIRHWNDIHLLPLPCGISCSSRWACVAPTILITGTCVRSSVIGMRCLGPSESSSVFKMQQKKQYLHELLREEQEPFQLNTYIADRRCENRRLPLPPKTSAQEVLCYEAQSL
nr:uncharacterized protein LOC109149557 [Ipomoea trifida]